MFDLCKQKCTVENNCDYIMSSLNLKQMDEALGRYYAQCNGSQYFDDSGIGKFFAFCEANDFDYAGVGDELQAGPDDCVILDFDEDFPFEIEPENRNELIYKIIKKCYENPEEAYLYLHKTFEIKQKYFDIDEKLDDQKFQQIEKYMQYCNKICAQATATGAFLKMVYISEEITDVPYFLLLADSFARDRIAHYLLINKVKKEYESKIKQLLPADQSSVTVNKLTVRSWVEINKHMKQIKSWSKHEIKKEFDLVKAALFEYYHRICHLIKVVPTFQIQDDYEQICEYISTAVDFVYNLAQNKFETQTATCPFQYDFCLA
eukprot:15267_1